MTVINEIKPLEIDGKSTTETSEKRRLVVTSHHVYSDRVFVQLGEHSVLVVADHLIRAVNNATNHR